MPGERWQNMLRDQIKLQVERTTIEPTEAELSLLSLVASGFNPCALEDQDAQVQRQRKVQLAAQVTESLNASISAEFGFFDFLKGKKKKKKKKKINEEESSKSNDDNEEDSGDPEWDESQHPRDVDGKFTDGEEGGSIGKALKALGDAAPPGRQYKEVKNMSPIVDACPEIDGVATCGGAITTKLSDGTKLGIYDVDKNDLSSTQKKDIIDSLGDLKERYPGASPVTKIVLRGSKQVSDELGFGLGAGVMAWVSSDDQSVINVNAGHWMFEPGGEAQKYRPGKDMPSVKYASPVRFTLFHEFGHLFDYTKNGEPGSSTQSLYDNPSIKSHLSEYGQTASPEAYADAFADWHLSNGYTENPASIAYAEHEGWKSYKPKATLSIQAAAKPKVIIAIDPKKGLVVIGDVPWATVGT